MPSIFDGVAEILSDVFGDPVTYLPAAGSSRPITSIFREAPIEVDGADGQTLRIDAPSWRVARSLAPYVSRGDHIMTQDDRVFVVTTVHPTGSPAQDAFFVCELQLAWVA